MRNLTTLCRNYQELVDHLSLLVEKGAPTQCMFSSSMNHPEDFENLPPEVLEMVEKLWEW